MGCYRHYLSLIPPWVKEKAIRGGRPHEKSTRGGLAVGDEIGQRVRPSLEGIACTEARSGEATLVVAPEGLNQKTARYAVQISSEIVTSAMG